MQVRVSPSGKTKGATKKVKGKATGVSGISRSRRDYPQSTNVSSPIQAIAPRRKVQGHDGNQESTLHRNGYERDNFVVSDLEYPSVNEGDEEEEDAFEPIREAGKYQASKKRKLGPPITMDEKMDRLNETHRMVVEDFMINAKKECEKVNESFPSEDKILIWLSDLDI